VWKGDICAGIDEQMDDLRMTHLHGYLYDPSAGEVGWDGRISGFISFATTTA
jgi:hypothetical protein